MIREYLKKINPVTCIVIFVAFAAVVGQASAKEYASNQYADMTGQEDTEAEETTEVTTEAPAQVVAEPQPETEVVEPIPEPEPEVVEPEPEPEPIVEAPQPDPTIRICIDPGHGCMVLMTCSRYQPANTKVASLYDTELAMAQNIIANLNGLGIPSIIVEHAFLSSENDYRDYLNSDEKLDALARADAYGIASALGLH